MSNDLCWKKHIDKVCQTVAIRTGLINRLKFKLQPAQLTVLVHGIILSHVKYCLSIFTSVRINEDDARNGQFNKLQVQLNNIARLIHRIKREDHVSREDLTKLSPWVSFNHMSANAIILDSWRALNDPTLSTMYTCDYNRNTRSASNEILKPSQHYHSNFVAQGLKLLNDPRFSIVRNINDPKHVKHHVKANLKTLPL